MPAEAGGERRNRQRQGQAAELGRSTGEYPAVRIGWFDAEGFPKRCRMRGSRLRSGREGWSRRGGRGRRGGGAEAFRRPCRIWGVGISRADGCPHISFALTHACSIFADLARPTTCLAAAPRFSTRRTASMSLVVPEAHVQFQHILRLLNTNVDGKRKIMVRPPPWPTLWKCEPDLVDLCAVRLDRDQGCWSSLRQPRLQEG